MAADVVGYSRMVAEDEEDTLRRLIAYRDVFADFVARGGGRIFNTAGDAVLAEFPSAVEGLRAAVEIQESIRTRNLAYPESRHMRFRIGMTIGDVVERDGDLLGDGVNVAARLEGLAEPGGICVARSVHEQVGNKLSVTFRDIGPQSVKNIPLPVHAFKISTALPEPQPAAIPPAAPPPNRRPLAAGIIVALLLAGGGALLFEGRPSPRSAPRAAGQTTAAVVAAPAAQVAPRPDIVQEAAPALPAPPVVAEPHASRVEETPADTSAASANPPQTADSSAPAAVPEPAVVPSMAPPSTPAPSDAAAPPSPVAANPPAQVAPDGVPVATPSPQAKDDEVISDPALLQEIETRLYEQNFDPGPPGSAAMAIAVRSFETRAGTPPSDTLTMRLLQALRDAPPLKPWGSIAYAEGGKRWGMSWALDSRREALAEARRRCGADNCTAAISFFGHRCGAFAVSARGWSITWRDDAALARQGALDVCGQHGPTCHIVGAVCANGTERVSILGSDQKAR